MHRDNRSAHNATGTTRGLRLGKALLVGARGRIAPEPVAIPGTLGG